MLTGSGLATGALARAEELGCEAFQIFVGNPRGWALSPGDPVQDARFRAAVVERGLRVFVHAPYLLNLASPTPSTYERSVALVAHQLVRAAAIGAEGVVVHTGSYVDPDGGPAAHRAALRRVREGLLPVLAAGEERSARDGVAAPWLLLEPTAGQGRSVCAGVDDIAPYLAALDDHPRAAVCLDTCHVFAAGAPLDEPGGTTATLDRLVHAVGAERLRLLHVNDSRDPRGSLRDRHEKLGAGHIGVGAFAELLAHPATASVPLIAETPGSRTPGDADLALLRRLRASASTTPGS